MASLAVALSTSPLMKAPLLCSTKVMVALLIVS